MVAIVGTINTVTMTHLLQRHGQMDVLFYKAELSDATGTPEGFQFS